MKPFIHAKNSVNRHGGVQEDYQPIHDFMDSSKVACSLPQHRAILHSTFGVYLAEKVFGITIVNSDGKKVSTRQIAEEHVFEDLGCVPTVETWLKGLPLEDWMLGPAHVKKKTKQFKLFNQTMID